MENQAPKPTISKGPEKRAKLLETAKEASSSPGVYLMRDERGGVLYVGKAKNLKNRICTYFQLAEHDVPRTEMLVNRVDSFDVILTETEAEAFILEATFIKKHRPKFNVRLKDDKAYPYIKIQIREKFPRVEWTRRVLKDGARYFGPFPSAWAARQVLELLNQTFRLRDCSDNTFSHRSRPCILGQIKRCSASCVGGVNEQAYRNAIYEVISVLEGKDSRLIDRLRSDMDKAAEEEEYELAALYRDQIQNLEVVTAVQVVDEAGSDRSRDVIYVARQGDVGHGVLVKVRAGKFLAVKHFHVENTDPSLSDSEVLSNFISQYYFLHKYSEEAEEDFKPDQVLVDGIPENIELLEKSLEIKVKSAVMDFEKKLVNVAKANATYALEQDLKRKTAHSYAALEEVQEKLHLQKLPGRIECFDISNIQEEDAVASRVVFVEGAPEKELYRRYKIKTVDGANDFAMMKEVLSRRFYNDSSLPDLLLVDGGKGQLAQAIAIMEELAIQGVDVAAIAKAKVESDFTASEVKASLERVFIPNRKNPIALYPNTEAFKLLTHIRDEAHRFAICYHRNLRSKRFT